MNRTLIVLTATVTPPAGVPALRLSEPAERVAQYLDTVPRWAALATRLGGQVLLLDSSPQHSSECRAVGAQVDRLRDGGMPVSFLHHPVTEDQHRLGKGVGEAHLLREVARNHLSASDVVIKCTGRLWVNELEGTLPPERDGVTVALRPDLTWSDSRLFMTTAAAFSAYLTNLDDLIDEERGVFLEHALARRAMAAFADGVPFRPFRRLPRFLGQSGSTGDRYDSVSRRLRLGVQDAIRTRLGPRIYL